MKQMNILVKGRVQGVFFRSTVKKIADDLGVNGFVKNLDDGSVEIVAQKDQKTLDLFVETIRKNPGKATISDIKIATQPPENSFSSFTIDYLS